MAKQPRFQLAFSSDVVKHLDAIELKYHAALRKEVEEKLSFDPDVETRNRKPLQRQPGPFDAPWELRCGPQNCFRVFYKIDPAEQIVGIVAIGVKERNRLLFGGKEFQS